MRRASAIVTFSVIALAILYGFPGRTVAQGGDVWIKITGIKTQEPMPQYPSRFQVNISINYDSGLGPESAAIEVRIEDRATEEIVDIIQGPANGAPGAFNLASDTVTLLVPTVKKELDYYGYMRKFGLEMKHSRISRISMLVLVQSSTRYPSSTLLSCC